MDINERKKQISKIKKIYRSQKKSSIVRKHLKPLYTLEELIDFMYSNGYETLYSNWKNNNFKRELAPSIDRLDDNLGYSLVNIRLVTKEENIKKDLNKRVKNKRDKNITREVTTFDPVTKEVRIFNNLSAVAKFYKLNLSTVAESLRAGTLIQNKLYGFKHSVYGQKQIHKKIKGIYNKVIP